MGLLWLRNWILNCGHLVNLYLSLVLILRFLEIAVTFTKARTLLFGIRKDASIFELKTLERVKTCDNWLLVLVFPIFNYFVVMAKSLCPLVCFLVPAWVLWGKMRKRTKVPFELWSILTNPINETSLGTKESAKHFPRTGSYILLRNLLLILPQNSSLSPFYMWGNEGVTQ